MNWLLGLILLIPSLACAEEKAILKFGGLNNAVDAAAIPDTDCRDCLNVELNKTASGIKKRDGYTSVLTPGDTATSLTSIFGLRNAAGSECIILSDGAGNIQASTNLGSTVHVTTITAGSRLYCQSNNGDAYCFSDSADGNVPFKYNCTTFVSLTSSATPIGKFNAFTQDRHLIAGTTDYPYRMYVSKSGDYANFLTGIESVDAWTEDIGYAGDKITGLFFLNGRVIIGKEYSIFGCALQDQFDTECYTISNDVGMVGPESMVLRDGMGYFKGSDNRFYKINGVPGNIEEISEKIPGSISSFPSGKTRSYTQTDKADWDAGTISKNGPTDSASTSQSVGFVEPKVVFSSSIGLSSMTFEMVDVDTTVYVSGYLDNFDDGDTNGWTTSGGTVYVTAQNDISAYRATNGLVYAYKDEPQSTGTWSWAFKSTDTATSQYVLVSVTSSSFNSGYGLKIQHSCGGTTPSVTFGCQALTPSGCPWSKSTEIVGLCDGSEKAFRVTKSSPGHVSLWVDGVFISSGQETSISSGAYFSIVFNNVSGSSSKTHFSKIRLPAFYERQASTIYDIGFSTPVYGPYSISLTSSSTSSMTFSVQGSTANDGGGFSTFATIANGEKIALDGNRYIRHRIYSSPAESDSYASISTVSINASSTGTFTTQCLSVGSGISAWGTLEAGLATDAGSSITLSISSATSCTDTFGVYTTQTEGTTISIATAAAVKIRATFSINSSTNVARLDSLVVNWTEGSLSPISVGTWWDDGIYWGVSDGPSSNNKTLKYDMRAGEWFPFDIPMSANNTYNNRLYFGTPSSKNVFKFSDIVASSAPKTDNGTAINSYWKSKYFFGNDPFKESTLDRISIIATKKESGTLLGTWQMNGEGVSDSFTINLSTGDNAVRHNYSVPFGALGTFWDLRLSDSSIYGWEVLGIKFDTTPQVWRPIP